MGKPFVETFLQSWVYGGTLAGLTLLIVAIGLYGPLGTPLFVVFLLLPLYMVHQYEEHAGDRFRLFVDRWIGQGQPVLTHLAIFVINVPGVWGIYAVVFVLASTIDIGFGLIAGYTTLVNAIAHIGQAAKMKLPNPGLVTAIVLFLPAAIWTIALLVGQGVPWGYHLLGIACALGIHGLIVAHVLRRLRGFQIPASA